MRFSDLKIVVRLVASHARQHPARMLLTIVSTIAAASIVVWVVSGYDSLVEKFDDFAEGYLGRYELVLLPAAEPVPAGPMGGGGAGLSAELLEAVRQDPAVAAVEPVFQARVRVQKVGATEVEDAAFPPAVDPNRIPTSAEVNANMQSGRFRLNRTPSLVGTDATEPPHNIRQGRWIDPQHPDRLEGVISSGSAEQLDLKLGDEVTVRAGMGFGPPGRGPSRALQDQNENDAPRIKIVGIIEQMPTLPPPKFTVGLPPSREQALRRGPPASALYVPIALAEKLSGAPARFNYAGIVLRPGSKAEELQASWAERLAAAKPQAEMQSLADVNNEITGSTTNEVIRNQAYSATGISLLAALFIVFTTLSMGVHERTRQFAVLRAVSLTKAQIAAMIGIESVGLGLIGWGGGILAGWGLLTTMKALKPDLFREGVSLGTWCIILSGLCALGGALAAAVLPAWRATRVSPLEAMAPQSRQYPASLSWWATILGVALIMVNPLVVFWIPMADASRYTIAAAVGCTTMAVGFVLLAPATIIVTEKLFSPVVARLLGFNRQLLTTLLTSNLWRTLGTTIALTLGLGLFVAMQTWGYSMLGPFFPGDWAPDMLVVMNPTGVPLAEVASVQKLPGIKAEQCLPLAVEQCKFADDVTGFHVRASAARQDNCVLIGVDVDKGLAGRNPLFDFQFAAGNRADAAARLKQGRYCLVPDHFARESGLTVGDKFAVIPPEAPGERLEYEIAGVVSMSGWHWISKVGLRNRNAGRSAGLMFADFDQIRKDFHIERTGFFWMNLDGTATEKEIEASLQAVADKYHDPQLAVAGRRGREGFPAAGARPGGGRRGPNATSVRYNTREEVRAAIRERADGIIWGLSELPLVTLAVTALGVMNTILSSVRARRWELGVMRALGMTRMSLFRLILAESILVAISACILSFGFGVMAGYCGTGVTRYINIRGGMVTPLIVPWTKLAIGFAITAGLCLLAAFWPAASTGRAEPLRLLQAGRGAM